MIIMALSLSIFIIDSVLLIGGKAETHIELIRDGH
jgi:hypothetical protein